MLLSLYFPANIVSQFVTPLRQLQKLMYQYGSLFPPTFGVIEMFFFFFVRLTPKDALAFSSPIFVLILTAGAHGGGGGGGPQSAEPSTRRQREADAKKRRSVDNSGGAVAGGGGTGGGGDLLDEELHVYIAAMQLFPIKLNFSFIKNADVKVILGKSGRHHVCLCCVDYVLLYTDGMRVGMGMGMG